LQCVQKRPLTIRAAMSTRYVMDVQTHGICSANILLLIIVLTGIKNRLIQKQKPRSRKALVRSLEILKCAKESPGFLCIDASCSNVVWP